MSDSAIYVQKQRHYENTPENNRNGMRVAFRNVKLCVSVCKMKINELIKAAIQNKDLRHTLVNDPFKVCRNFGIPVEGIAFDSSAAKPFADQSIMQGGYRP